MKLVVLMFRCVVLGSAAVAFLGMAPASGDVPAAVAAPAKFAPVELSGKLAYPSCVGCTPGTACQDPQGSLQICR